MAKNSIRSFILIVMLANTNYYNNTYNPSFGAKNVSIRKADKICRLVNKEFPMASSTKMINYKSVYTTRQSKRFFEYIGDMIMNLREYYFSNNEGETQIRMLMGLKKTKTGNCFEKAHATNVALKINGYKDVNTVSLYAINNKTGEIRDLDHIVSAVNLGLPKDYHYWDGREKVTKEYFVTPNKKTILLDSWAGVADNITSMQANYKGNIRLSQKLEPNERLMFLPGKSFELSKEDIDYFKLKYPNLLLRQDKEFKINRDLLNDSRYNLSEMSDNIIRNVKQEHHIGAKNKPKNNHDEFWSTVMSIFSDPTTIF